MRTWRILGWISTPLWLIVQLGLTANLIWPSAYLTHLSPGSWLLLGLITFTIAMLAGLCGGITASPDTHGLITIRFVVSIVSFGGLLFFAWLFISAYIELYSTHASPARSTSSLSLSLFFISASGMNFAEGLVQWIRTRAKRQGALAA